MCNILHNFVPINKIVSQHLVFMDLFLHDFNFLEFITEYIILGLSTIKDYFTIIISHGTVCFEFDIVSMLTQTVLVAILFTLTMYFCAKSKYYYKYRKAAIYFRDLLGARNGFFWSGNVLESENLLVMA